MRTIQLFMILMVAGMLSVNAQIENNESQIDKELFFTKRVTGNMDEVYQRVVEALKVEKFGVITEVDMAKTLKEKLEVDMQPYKILGVCNPGFAYDALQAESNIGVFLPCKVILKQVEENIIEVVSINPEAMMKMLENKKLNKTADAVGQKLEKVIMGL